MSSQDFARDNNVNFDCLTPTLSLLSCVGKSLVRLDYSIDQAETVVACLKYLLDFYAGVGSLLIWVRTYKVEEEPESEA